MQPTTIKAYYDKLNENRGTIEVPEWGKTFYVGPLTYNQYQKIEAGEKIADSERGFAIIEACAKNEKGEPAFDPREIADLRRYAPSWMITRTANAIMEVQGRFKDQQEDAQGN